jgi:hypothetical protein
LLGVDVGSTNWVGVAPSVTTVAPSVTTGVAVAACDAVVSVFAVTVGTLGVATLAAGVALHATKNRLMNANSTIRPRIVLFLSHKLLSVINPTHNYLNYYHIL